MRVYWNPSISFLMFSWSIVWRVISRPCLLLREGRQLAEQNQIAGLEKSLSSASCSIGRGKEDALVAVDICDGAPAVRGVHERRIGHR